ncbi:ras-related GTP-binding protein, putative [Bodo saltans]|uniref:Ras-related GTP-binding protein, putative n=1 Tax=Bodo saltans TaxID=75058 RepID=A0A0S4JUJ4_BODSA|nr:ras-related GTP-binding protein, putative [Bodo saltans]|eukprot:CUG93116.1 ras-related GTP-binding protein, putative [Bodo saltans]
MTSVQKKTRGNAGGGSASPTRADGAGREAKGEVTLKIICVGAAATGKTTFLKFWETNKESPAHSVRTTISMEFHKHEMDIALPPPNVAPSITSFLPPEQNHTDTDPSSTSSSPNLTQQPSGANFSRENSIVRENSIGGSESRRGSVAPYRLAAPLVRDNFGPETEQRRAIVKVWDIQGQEHSKTMTRGFYSGALGAMVFCELASHTDSLDAAVLWKKDVDSKVWVSKGDGREEKIPCWLVVNKYDVIKDLPAPQCPTWATHQALDAFVKAHGFVGWSYASGLKGVNVLDTVRAAVSRCAERFPEEIRNVASGAGPAASNGILLQRPRKQAEKKRDCC